MQPFLKIEREGAVVTLTMNSPDTRNPLTGNSAADEFAAACADISRDMTVRAVIVTGAGSAFSAGGNIKDMQRYTGDAIAPMVIRDDYRRGVQRIPLALYYLEVPTIAAVNGPAIGAGCDLACMCDIRIASEKATFAESFVKVGLIAGDGGAWLLPRTIGRSKAAELTFTGDTLDAQAALDCGLVSRVVPHDELMQEAHKLATRIAANPGPTLRLSKRLMREGEHLRLDSLLELAAAYQALTHKTPEHAEAVAAFIEKRPPKFGN